MEKIETIPGIPLDYDQIEVYEIELPVKKNKHYGEIMFLGDLHIGHESFSVGHLHKYLNFLKKEPQIQIIGMGDYFEAEEFTNYLQQQENTLEEQIRIFLEKFIPIKDQIRIMLYGNHDERFMRESKCSVDLLEYVALKMGKKPNKDIFIGKPERGMLVVVKVKDKNYPIYIHHSATKASVNLMTQLKRSSTNWLVPLVAHGHVHKMAWTYRTYFSVSKVNNTWYRSIFRQYLLLTGCFLKYPSYAEKIGMAITDIGAPIVRFYTDRYELEYVDPRIAYKDYVIKGGEFYQGAKVPDVHYPLKQNKYEHKPLPPCLPPPEDTISPWKYKPPPCLPKD